MVKTRVVYIGPIRSLAGKREEEVSLPDGTSVKDLLYYLIQEYGEPFREAVLNKRGELQPMLQLLAKDSRDNSCGLDTKLNHVKQITLLQLLQPFAGG